MTIWIPSFGGGFTTPIVKCDSSRLRAGSSSTERFSVGHAAKSYEFIGRSELLISFVGNLAQIAWCLAVGRLRLSSVIMVENPDFPDVTASGMEQGVR